MSQILVVDDEADISEALRALLELEGYQVDVAADGGECLRYLRARRPDLIMLDLMMPVLNGFQVLEAMQADGWRELPVIVMSAARPPQPFTHGNVRAFLTKPFDLQSLLDSVEQALRSLPAAARGCGIA